VFCASCCMLGYVCGAKMSGGDLCCEVDLFCVELGCVVMCAVLRRIVVPRPRDYFENLAPPCQDSRALCWQPWPWTMRSIKILAPVLVPLLVDVLAHLNDYEGTTRDIDVLEFMSGAAEITKASGQVGLTSYGYDKSYSKTDINNMNTKAGFERAMGLAMRIKRHGSVWMAPVCSSWVWIARHGSGRTLSAAHGDPAVHRVRSGNRMVVRLVLIMLVLWMKGAHLFLENPSSTVIHWFSPLREVIQCILVHRISTPLSAYGSSTMKPITIWSSSPRVSSLHRPKAIVQEKLFSRKDNCVTGKRAALKSSQAYPAAFGRAVAQIFLEIAKEASIGDLLEQDAAALLASKLSSVEHKTKRARK